MMPDRGDLGQGENDQLGSKAAGLGGLHWTALCVSGLSDCIRIVTALPSMNVLPCAALCRRLRFGSWTKLNYPRGLSAATPRSIRCITSIRISSRRAWMVYATLLFVSDRRTVLHRMATRTPIILDVYTRTVTPYIAKLPGGTHDLRITIRSN